MKTEERIVQIKEEIKSTSYHKGTEHHIGKLRAKLAKLKDQRLIPKKSGKRSGFSLKKEGDATVVLVGFPSVGKSTLLNKLTRAKSKVADYDFTTLSVIPGILEYQGARIQILDLPGVIEKAAQGRGGGRQILAAARAADLILVLLDVQKPNQEKIIRKELFDAGVRLDQKSPKVVIKKQARGGLRILSPTLSQLKQADIERLAEEFGLKNAELMIKEDLSFERLVDALSANRVYLPTIFVFNKIDLLKQPPKLLRKHLLISADKGLGLTALKQEIWQKLGLIRVYLKEKGKEPDFEKPFIMKKNQSLKDLIKQISICEKADFEAAEIYGPGAKFSGQIVSLNHQPQDQLIITFLSR